MQRFISRLAVWLALAGGCLILTQVRASVGFGEQVDEACESFVGETPFAEQECALCHVGNPGNPTQRVDPEWTYWEKQALTLYCSDLLLRVEEPSEGETYTGVSNVRGFAVALDPVIITEIELLIDGESMAIIPSGGSRGDVALFFDGIDLTDPGDSGYSMALNYSVLDEGPHSVTIQVSADNGETGQVTVPFNVDKFDFEGNFLNDLSRVSLAGASVRIEGDSVVIENLEAAGQRYDVRMGWRTATQQLDIEQIVAQGEAIPSMAGTWGADETFVSEDCAFAEPGDFPEAGVDVLMLDQQGNQVFGTTSGGTVEVSGTVTAGGDFQLVSPGQTEMVAEGCSQTVTQEHTGNLFSGTMQTVTQSMFSGSCPSEFNDCQVVYQGTLMRTGAAGILLAPGLHRTLLETLAR